MTLDAFLAAVQDPRNRDLILIATLLVLAGIGFWIAVFYPGRGPVDTLIESLEHHPPAIKPFAGSREKRGRIAVFPSDEARRRRELHAASVECPPRTVQR